jgi:hypothetical protein
MNILHGYATPDSSRAPEIGTDGQITHDRWQLSHAVASCSVPRYAIIVAESSKEAHNPVKTMFHLFLGRDKSNRGGEIICKSDQ